MEKVIAYLESPTWLGHAATQQQIYVKTLLGMGKRVIVVTPYPEETQLWKDKIAPAERERLYICKLEMPPQKGLAKKFKWLWVDRQISRAAKEAGWSVDVVLVTWLDGLKVSFVKALLTGLFFRYSWAGLYFLPTHFRSDTVIAKRKRIRQILADSALLLCSSCRGIGVLDEGTIPGLQKVKRTLPVFLPELTEKAVIETAEIDSIRLMAGGRCIFALLGHLAARKGVLEFLRLARDFDDDKGFFLMAGQFDPASFEPEELAEIRQLLETKGRNNCFFKLAKVESAKEFNAFLACSDVLYLGYKNFYHSSGLLAKAAHFRKPVIAGKGYCIGERVERYKLGITVNISCYQEIKAAAEVLAEEETRRRFVGGSGFAEYDSQNSVAALRNALQQLLD